jgi:hypothetical protein
MTTHIKSNAQIKDMQRYLATIDPSIEIRKLDLSGNQILKIEGLDDFPSLEALDLSQNRIVVLGGGPSKLSCFEQLVNLRVLVLRKNSISKLEYLHCLPQLEHLDVSSNNIQVIENLQQNINLTYLNLSYNNIRELTNLAANRNLRNLNLDNNILTSLSFAAKQLPVSLERLSFANNSIDDILHVTFLSKLTALKQLNFEGNPLVKASLAEAFDFRPLILFLLRDLTHINGIPVRKAEKTGSLSLFLNSRGEQNNELSRLLKPGQSQGLVRYLCDKCPLPPVDFAPRVQGERKNANHSSDRPADRDRGLPGERGPSVAWSSRGAAASFRGPPARAAGAQQEVTYDPADLSIGFQPAHKIPRGESDPRVTSDPDAMRADHEDSFREDLRRDARPRPEAHPQIRRVQNAPTNYPQAGGVGREREREFVTRPRSAPSVPVDGSTGGRENDYLSSSERREADLRANPAGPRDGPRVRRGGENQPDAVSSQSLAPTRSGPAPVGDWVVGKPSSGGRTKESPVSAGSDELNALKYQVRELQRYLRHYHFRSDTGASASSAERSRAVVQSMDKGVNAISLSAADAYLRENVTRADVVRSVTTVQSVWRAQRVRARYGPRLAQKLSDKRCARLETEVSRLSARQAELTRALEAERRAREVQDDALRLLWDQVKQLTMMTQGSARPPHPAGGAGALPAAHVVDPTSTVTCPSEERVATAAPSQIPASVRAAPAAAALNAPAAGVREGPQRSQVAAAVVHSRAGATRAVLDSLDLTQGSESELELGASIRLSQILSPDASTRQLRARSSLNPAGDDSLQVSPSQSLQLTSVSNSLDLKSTDVGKSVVLRSDPPVRPGPGPDEVEVEVEAALVDEPKPRSPAGRTKQPIAMDASANVVPLAAAHVAINPLPTPNLSSAGQQKPPMSLPPPLTPSSHSPKSGFHSAAAVRATTPREAANKQLSRPPSGDQAKSIELEIILSDSDLDDPDDISTSPRSAFGRLWRSVWPFVYAQLVYLCLNV